jgi:hypothetical protein
VLIKPNEITSTGDLYMHIIISEACAYIEGFAKKNESVISRHIKTLL